MLKQKRIELTFSDPLPDFDKKKHTWIRNIVLFMCRNPLFRARWFVKLFKNYPVYIFYRDGKEIGVFLLKEFMPSYNWMKAIL